MIIIVFNHYHFDYDHYCFVLPIWIIINGIDMDDKII